MWTKLSGITRLCERQCDDTGMTTGLLKQAIEGDAFST